MIEATQLNKSQFDAVTHTYGPQLVLSGAGTGKTRVITFRIAWLIKEFNVSPSSILALTFTNKAAKEMRERATELIGSLPLEQLFVGTFHSYALRIIRKFHHLLELPRYFNVIDRKDQLLLAKDVGTAYRVEPKEIVDILSKAKSVSVSPIDWLEEEMMQGRSYIYPALIDAIVEYERNKKRSYLLDFDDLLLYYFSLLDTSYGEQLRSTDPFVLVDEFQDTNFIQFEILKRMLGTSKNITAVGDEDQSIYSWRGARVDNLLDFPKVFPNCQIRKLEENYRSPSDILILANRLISNNSNRIGKVLRSKVQDRGEVHFFTARDPREEAAWVAYRFSVERSRFSFNDMAVLVRTTFQTRVFEEEFSRHNIPYIIRGATAFYEREEIKDIVAYLRVIHNPHDDWAMLRIINTPPRGIGKVSIERIRHLAEENDMPIFEVLKKENFPKIRKKIENFLDDIEKLINCKYNLSLPVLLEAILEQTSYIEYLSKRADGVHRIENVNELISVAHSLSLVNDGISLEDFIDSVALATEGADKDVYDEAVSIMTFHAAKGLEFDVVAVCGLEEGLLPHFKSFDSPEDIEEERRLLYVGVTRAKRVLMLSNASIRTTGGNVSFQKPSRFLQEMNTVATNKTTMCENSGVKSHDECRLYKGSRVVHPKFGKGIIRKVGSNWVEVDFFFSGIKKIRIDFLSKITVDKQDRKTYFS